MVEPVPLNVEWIADQLDGLDYRPGSPTIRRILLLFNLATLLRNEQSNMRFQFNSFKTALWDIEHVRSVAPDRPGPPKSKVEWLVRCRGDSKDLNEPPRLRAHLHPCINLPHTYATHSPF